MDRTSALGYGLGYLGGGLLFAVNVFMFQKPQVFGLSDGSQAGLWSFLMVGFWWMLFSLPLFRRSEEQTSELQSLMRSSSAVFCLKKKKTQTNIQCYRSH